MAAPTFSILTPSLNDLRYLKRCCASVRDQGTVAVEHIVVDGGSNDGTIEWLRTQTDVRWAVSADSGMYEALNKGLESATGEWIGFLNCDEQYLPGALHTVKEYLTSHAGVDLVSGDFLVVRPDGSLVCHRKEIVPRPLYIKLSYLYSFTCSLFVHRGHFRAGLRFAASMRSAADEEFVLRILGKARVGHVRRYLAAFTDRPESLSRSTVAHEETVSLRRQNPFWLKALRPLVITARHVEKTISGGYKTASSLSYELFVGEDYARRQQFAARHAPCLWKRR